LAIRFKKAHEQLEEELKMPYVTSNERLAKEEGLSQGLSKGMHQGLCDAILDVLEVRFNEVPYSLKEKINYCDDLKKLKQLLRQAASIKTIDELDA
jgi:hypothetical protein